MTTTNISGTWSEKQKEANGFDTHADLIHSNRILRVPFVGFAEFHQWTEKVAGNVLTVRITAIEPAIESDGTDPTGLGKQVFDLLDALRKQRGKGAVDDIVSGGGDMPGQEAFDFDGLGDMPDDEEPADTNASGDVVPPPSGEEVVAELEERRARKKAAPAAKFEGGSDGGSDG